MSALNDTKHSSPAARHSFRQEPDGGWTLRFGPLSAADIAHALSAFVYRASDARSKHESRTVGRRDPQLCSGRQAEPSVSGPAGRLLAVKSERVRLPNTSPNF